MRFRLFYYVGTWLTLSLPVGAQPSRPFTATVSTLAGVSQQKGSADGSAATARFKWPMGIALEANGVVYLTDTYNHTIRQITTNGDVTTLAGTAGVKGSRDATGPSAQFENPVGIALDLQGTLYVADTGNHTIRRITPAGIVTTLAGQAGQAGSADGLGAAARFRKPHGIAVDAQGHVYVADTDNHTIRRITPDGRVTTVAGQAGAKGSADGLAATVRFKNPAGLALDAAGNLYISDNGNYVIRKLSTHGVVTTLAGQAGQKGSEDRPGAMARFNTPNGIAVDGQGNIYVADFTNSTIRQITPAGRVTTLAGKARGWSHQDGVGPAARFLFPVGIAVTPDGHALYIAEMQSHTIRKMQ